MNDFLERLSEYADILAEKTTELAPYAYEVLLGVIQAQGIFWLTVGLALTVVTYILTRKALAYFAEGSEMEDNHEDPFVKYMLGTFLVIAAIISGTAAATDLINLSNWLAAVDPELELARRIYESVTD